MDVAFDGRSGRGKEGIRLAAVRIRGAEHKEKGGA